MDLTELGWNDYFSALFEPFRIEGLSPLRVVAQHRGMCTASGETGDLLAEVSGRFRHLATDPSSYPTVGDWVALEPFARDRGLVHAVLERRSAFVRKAAGETTEAQVVAANVDTVLSSRAWTAISMFAASNGILRRRGTAGPRPSSC